MRDSMLLPASNSRASNGVLHKYNTETLALEASSAMMGAGCARASPDVWVQVFQAKSVWRKRLFTSMSARCKAAAAGAGAGAGARHTARGDGSSGSGSGSGAGSGGDCDGRQWWEALHIEAPNLVPAVFEDTGRGMAARGVIRSGDLLVSVPRAALLTPVDLPNTALLKPHAEHLADHVPAVDRLAVLLLAHAAAGDASPLAGYIRSLPSTYTTPEWWDDAELAALDGLPCGAACRRHVADVRRRHVAVVDAVSALPSLGAALDVSWPRFRWATSTLSSRTCFMPEALGGVALCPYLDLLNHSAEPVATATFTGDAYTIVSQRAYKPGDQVFIHYGPLDTETLVTHWGFVLPRNPHASLPVPVGALADADEWAAMCRAYPVAVATLALRRDKAGAVSLAGPDFVLLSAARLVAAARGAADAAATTDAVLSDAALPDPAHEQVAHDLVRRATASQHAPVCMDAVAALSGPAHAVVQAVVAEYADLLAASSATRL